VQVNGALGLNAVPIDGERCPDLMLTGFRPHQAGARNVEVPPPNVPKLVHPPSHAQTAVAFARQALDARSDTETPYRSSNS
jgi:hypothetical protein